jgi:hypothetical protein
MSFTVTNSYQHSVHLDNIPDFIITNIQDEDGLQVDVYDDTLYTNVVFTSVYIPDLNNEVRFNLADIFRNFLKTNLPNADIFLQQEVYKGFGFVITGLTSEVTSAQYYEVLLSKAEVTDTPWNYMETHFLTLQPKDKYVTKLQPEHLTLNGTGPVSDLQLYARFYPKAGGHTDVALDAPDYTGINTYRFDWATLWQLRPGVCFDYIDIVAVLKEEDMMSQRYIYTQTSGHEHYFLWVNALGGIDTICCDGSNTLQPQVTHNVGRRQAQVIQLDDSDDYREWRQQSGWFPWKQREWLWDFVSSKLGHWLYDPEKETYTEIVITSAEMEDADDQQLVQFSFTYRRKSRGNAVGTSSRESSFSRSAADQAEEIDYDDSLVAEE